MLRFSGLYQENCSDLYVTCQVFAEGKPLALPVRTSYKAFSTRWKWVPVLYCVFSFSDHKITKSQKIYISVAQTFIFVFSNSLSVFWSLCSFSCCPVQLERMAAAASQVSRPSSKCPGCSHSVGHLWAWQSCTRRRHHCYFIWQIWVSLPSHYYVWLC